MPSERDVIRRHLEALLADPDAKAIPRDVVGRLLIQEAIELWKSQRSLDDIASELRFLIDTLDPDTDFEFMRP